MRPLAGHGALDQAGPAAVGTRDLETSKTALGQAGDGYLVFEGPGGAPERVTAGQLGVILREMGVRVAVLNACKTASRDGARSWSSVAAALLKAGVRSVVAMQHAVLDASAIAFAAAFYRSLALGGSLDEAARNGRIAVFDRGDGFGWAFTARRVGGCRARCDRTRSGVRRRLARPAGDRATRPDGVGSRSRPRGARAAGDVYGRRACG
jgi:CHAT domain